MNSFSNSPFLDPTFCCKPHFPILPHFTIAFLQARVQKSRPLIVSFMITFAERHFRILFLLECF